MSVMPTPFQPEPRRFSPPSPPRAQTGTDEEARRAEDATWPEHLRGVTTHVRRGAIGHSFRYNVDYVLIDPDSRRGPALFSRNRTNLASVHDRTHGGPRGAGRGADWARDVFARAGLAPGYRLRLLTQPRLLGFWFNPVSFWLAFAEMPDAPQAPAALLAVIAEVSNTFGQRHSYLCARPGFPPITPADEIAAKKVFHVSPFQDLSGGYRFRFAVTPDRIAIRIHLGNGDEGVIATLSGPRRPLTNACLVGAALRRPFGPLRTLALIYWQALRLKLKGAAYRPVPPAPTREVTR
ncbi:DUF1365 domain-containing protein [Acidimangrovimonas sediminis]|uniref:DUF1365 domain-containing protein n=1 Tax=Acidimangrovimonas sediminis TaxID=2056283 RepID=UPI001E28D7F0|nr:DUF1365 domain-containing protein [Acidimangrovimonas sediminis]